MRAEQVVYIGANVCYNEITPQELRVRTKGNTTMKEINIAKSISDLRKRKGVTQEQLAQALNISPQAVSKWETNTSLPDTQTLPLIAEYFGVSLDYLYYGDEYAYNDIYPKIWDKVAEHPQMSAQAYEEALKTFCYAHHAIGRWNNKDRDVPMFDEPLHIVGENGVSILSGKGYGAILTRGFFENIGEDTLDFAEKLLTVLSARHNMLVCFAIISMSDISFGEMQEKIRLDTDALRAALDQLIAANVVIEKKSKHKSLGLTYEINDMYHTCLCIMIATLEMQRISLKGISCCMGFGDYPIKL